MTSVFNVKPPEIVWEPPPESILVAYRGSIAHNMFVPSTNPNSIDDVDLIGIVVPHIKYFFGLREWGSRGTQEVKNGPLDVVLYEVRKAFRLLLQGNPNILSLLWTHPAHYVVCETWGRELIVQRSYFAGKHVYKAFDGYAYQQFLKMETREPAELREYLGVTAELKARGKHPNYKGKFIPKDSDDDITDCSNWGDEALLQRLARFQKKGENIGYMGDKRKRLVLEHGYDAKNAAHLIRLLRMCTEFMKTGELKVHRTGDVEELLAIKAGKWPLSQVKELANQLRAEMESARNRSPLPEEPDYESAERLLIDICAASVKK